MAGGGGGTRKANLGLHRDGIMNLGDGHMSDLQAKTLPESDLVNWKEGGVGEVFPGT